MINLLPVSCKKKAEREILRRFIVVFGLGLAFLFFVEAAAAFVLYFTSDVYLKNFQQQMASTENLAKMKNLVVLEENVGELNEFLKSFSSEAPDAEKISKEISIIAKFLPSSLKIKSFSFEPAKDGASISKVNLTGFAGSRDDLLDFTGDLRRSGEFESIQSPVSNILTEKEFDFLIEIVLKN
ncbi:MAG: hypothetical protein PHC85_02275 [Candidatus Pacebacteria bacterium]|nr:hypothetical protein [Candidatus Paceibacterota bacterium]